MKKINNVLIMIYFVGFFIFISYSSLVDCLQIVEKDVAEEMIFEDEVEFTESFSNGEWRNNFKVLR